LAGSVFEGLGFFSSLEDWAAPEVSGVVPGAKCILGWTILVFDTLVSMMFRTTSNLTGDVVAIVLSISKR